MKVLCQGCGRPLDIGEPSFNAFYQGLPNICPKCHSPVIISGERLRLESPQMAYARIRGIAQEV